MLDVHRCVAGSQRKDCCPQTFERHGWAIAVGVIGRILVRQQWFQWGLPGVVRLPTSTFALRVSGGRSWTSTGVAVLQSVLLPCLLEGALVALWPLAVVLGKYGLVFWAVWSLMAVGSTLKAVWLEPLGDRPRSPLPEHLGFTRAAIAIATISSQFGVDDCAGCASE